MNKPALSFDNNVKLDTTEIQQNYVPSALLDDNIFFILLHVLVEMYHL